MKFSKILFQFRSEYFLLFLPLNPQRPRKKKKKNSRQSLEKNNSTLIVLRYNSIHLRVSAICSASLPPSSLLGLPQKEKKKRKKSTSISSMVYFEKSFRESRCLDKPESRTGAWLQSSFRTSSPPGQNCQMVFLVSTPTAAKKRYVWIEMIHCIALYASAMQISIHVSPTPIISFHGGE